MSNRLCDISCKWKPGGSAAQRLSYFVMIPLLAPKGLEVIIPWYKTFFTAWSVLALAIIVLESFICFYRRRTPTPIPMGLVAYSLIAVAVSAFSSDGINDGLQKLFFYPGAFLYILSRNKEELRDYVMACAHILCGLLVLNFIIPSSLFAGSFHMTVLGHVQVFCQYGLLAIAVASFIYLKKWGSRHLAIVLGCLGFACLLTAETDSAHYSLVVFIGVLCLVKVFPRVIRLDLRPVVLLANLFSCLVVLLTVFRQSPLMDTGIDWTFNGRYFVWESAGMLIQQAPLFGYGVENAIISTFWSSGMNYAHNQIVQSLLDGGVVLMVAMVWMLCSVAGCVNKIADPQLHCISGAMLCASLFFMIFDCFTQYSYMFILFAFIACEGLLSVKESNSEPESC